MIKNNSFRYKLLLLLAYLAIYIIWGTTYLAVLWVLEGMKPFALSTLRYFIAGAILISWSLLQRHKWPGIKQVKISVLAGTIMLVGGSGLVVVAETYIGSGHAAVVVATEPLWFLILDKKRWRLYFSNVFVIAGLVLGFIGIVLFSSLAPNAGAEAESDNLFGTLLTLAGSLLWVVGTLYSDRHPEIRKYAHTLITGIQLAGAGIVSAFIALMLGDWQTFSFEAFTPQVLGGLIFLIVMGSIVAYVAYMWLITVQPPALVSTHTYINPVVAVAFGYLLANESISTPQVIALLIVLVGVVLTRVNVKE